MIKNIILRKWHRDLGYFFTGLIISYCISGIAQNHRGSWNPKQYEYKSQDIFTRLDTVKKENINDEVMTKILSSNGIKSSLQGVQIGNDPFAVKAFFDRGYVHIDLKTGKGKIEYMKVRPVIGHMSILHTNSMFLWTLYSDLFALGLMVMAVMGLFMVKGKYGFKKWGIKLLLAGLVVPLLFLLIITMNG